MDKIQSNHDVILYSEFLIYPHIFNQIDSLQPQINDVKELTPV